MGLQRRVIVATIGAILASIVPIALYGFTVDDALISCRYAHHIATGIGYRFNPTGPATDGVTPLPWPWLIALFARTSPIEGLVAAKVLGLLAWAATMAWMAVYVDGLAGKRVGWAHLALLVAGATPATGAWAVSGMETGFATALATAAVMSTGSTRARWTGALVAGLACTLRPELAPWAFTLALGHARCSLRERGCRPNDSGVIAVRVAGHAALALAPFLAVAAIRLVVFGAAAPLAVMAKPSDWHHGWQYALAGVLVTGPFAAVLAPRAWLRMHPWPRWILGAACVHVLSVALVGGDWMPLSRLLVPILPSLAIVFAHTAIVAPPWANILRVALCIAGQVFVFWRVGPAATSVMAQRMALVEQLRGKATQADCVAALDVGWVGASFGGEVIDLAGVTDRSVASLPGGHTTKAIPSLLLADRKATLVVLQLRAGMSLEQAWQTGSFERGVESRVATQPWTRAHFVPGFEIRASDQLRYGVLVRKPETDSAR